MNQKPEGPQKGWVTKVIGLNMVMYPEKGSGWYIYIAAIPGSDFERRFWILEVIRISEMPGSYRFYKLVY